MADEITAAVIAAGGALLAAIPAVFIACAANRISSDLKKLECGKAERELFEAFNTRFNSMNEELNTIRRGGRINYIGPINRIRTADDIAQDYLNLCSEEYLWHTRQMIGKDIWQVWMRGIVYYLEQPNTAIVAVFSREMLNAADCYYGLFDCPLITEALRKSVASA